MTAKPKHYHSNIYQNRISDAIAIAKDWAWIDGDQHKDWVIDQMIRVLLEGQYAKFREEMAEDWHCGIAP